MDCHGRVSNVCAGRIRWMNPISSQKMVQEYDAANEHKESEVRLGKNEILISDLHPSTWR